jgi:hypothetical protein
MTRKAHPKQFKTVAEALAGMGLSHGMKLKALNTPLRIAKALNVPIEALADQDAA